MKPFKTALVALILAAPIAAFSAPVKLTYSEANALFGALSKLQDGLSPANVGIAADDIWALTGVAKAYGKAQIAAAEASQRAVSAKDSEAAREKAQADWTAFTESEITVDLQPLNLPFTDDEIKAAKITPDVYAPIKHFLSPAKK